MIFENQSIIDAPPELVWQVTIDIEQWPEWTPTIQSVELLENQSFGPGSSALLKQPGMGTVKWTVTDLQPGRSFTWQGKARGLSMEAIHRLTPSGSGTEVHLELKITGLLARVMKPILRPQIEQALERENAGLKNHCEKLHQSQSGQTSSG